MDWVRIEGILQILMRMMILLAVFFLGFNAAGWTSQQVYEYCTAYKEAYCTAKMLNSSMSGANFSFYITNDTIFG